MDASDLRVFEAVARLGGMNRAAAELNTVQSNVTARVRQLESELGVALFQRHSRGVALTAAGRRLLPYAGRAASLMVDARRAALDAGRPAGPLQIGSLETTAALRLPPLLSAYAKSCPEVDLSLTMGTTCELIERVMERAIEGAFVCGPVQHPDLVAQVVFREELVLIAPRSVASLDAALEQPNQRIVVLRSGCSYRQRLEDLLRARGIAGMRHMELGTIEGMLGCVAAGLGVTLLPRGMVELARHAESLSAHALPPHEARVETVFVRPRDAFESSALAAFVQMAVPAASHVRAAE